jgi:hypothetical protein
MSDVARKYQIIPTLNAVTGLREEIMRIDRIGQAVKKASCIIRSQGTFVSEIRNNCSQTPIFVIFEAIIL